MRGYEEILNILDERIKITDKSSVNSLIKNTDLTLAFIEVFGRDNNKNNSVGKILDDINMLHYAICIKYNVEKFD